MTLGGRSGPMDKQWFFFFPFHCWLKFYVVFLDGNAQSQATRKRRRDLTP